MTRASCPEAELIAAYAEGRLVGDDAARMDEHLASCPTCPELFADAVRFVDEDAIAPLPFSPRPAIPRGTGFRLAAALAAAAALIVAFQTWRGRATPPPRDMAVIDKPRDRPHDRPEPAAPTPSLAESEVHTPTAPSVAMSSAPGPSDTVPTPALPPAPEVRPGQAGAVTGEVSRPTQPPAAPSAQATEGTRAASEARHDSEAVFRGAEEVTVESASRIEQRLVDAPATMSVITSESLETTPARSLGDVLRSVPGLNVIQSNARDFNLTARQATSTLASSTLVTVDGRSVYQDFLGFVLWDFVPSPASGDIEQIEVVRGPASVMWGANAVNGLVNVITKTPRAHEGFGLVLGGGLFDREGGSREADGNGYQFNGSFSFAKAPNDSWSYKLSAGYYVSDPFSRPVGTIPLDCHPLGVVPCRDAALQAVPGGLPIGGATYPADASQPGGFENDGTRQPKLDLRADQDLSSGGRITYVAGYGGTEGIVYTGIGPFDLKSGSHMGYGRVVYKNGLLHLGASVNALDAQAANLLATDPDTLGPVQLDVETRTYDIEFGNSSTLGGRQILTYGGNYRRNSFDVSLAEGPDRNELGAYGHWEYFVDKFRLAAGVRADKFGNLEQWAWSPRLSAMFKPTPDHSLRASYNRAFVSPSFVSNYLDQDFSSVAVDLTPVAAALPPPLVPLVPPPFLLTVNAFGNPDLRMSSTDAFELAYNGRFGSTTISLAGYLSDTDDSIAFMDLFPPGTPGLPSPTYYSPQNPARGVTLPTPAAPATPITLSPVLMGVLAQVPPQLGGPILLPDKAATYLNLGPIRNRGIEASIDHRFQRSLAFFANYSWQDTPEILRASSDQIPYPAAQLGIPAEHRFNVGFGYNGPLVFANANLNYASRALWVDVLSSEYAGFSDAYSMLNAAVGVKLGDGKVLVRLSGTNLANQQIQQHVFGDVLKRSVVFEVRFFAR